MWRISVVIAISSSYDIVFLGKYRILSISCIRIDVDNSSKLACKNLANLRDQFYSSSQLTIPCKSISLIRLPS